METSTSTVTSEAMRQSSAWSQLESIAPTLAYDHTAILGEDSSPLSVQV